MLKVSAIRAFSDNYIWCIIDERQKQAIIVDPGCSHSVLNFLETHELQLIAIFITHHHPDHIGGVVELKKHTNAKVYGFSRAGPKNNKLTFIDHEFDEGDTFSLLSTQFQIFEVPGHTLDHITFYSEPDSTHNSPWLFCGDTLFSGGCGRLFEGTPSQMYHSLCKLSSLPNECEVYCAHEYTLSNLAFAASLMPSNQTLQRYTDECKAKRASDICTLPSTIGQERDINPFLRTHDIELVINLKQLDTSLSLNDAQSHFCGNTMGKR